MASARKTPKRRGHAFATFAMEPNGEHVSDDGEDCSDGAGDNSVVAGGQVARNFDRKKSLSDVEDEGEDSEPAGAGAQHIGSSNIAAAGFTDVFFSKQPYQQIAEGN